MQITSKRVLWWAFLAGLGFTVGAGIVHFFGELIVGALALDQLGPWIAGK